MVTRSREPKKPGKRIRTAKPALVLNPGARIEVHVDVRTRGDARRRYTIDASQHPAYAEAFVQAAIARGSGSGLPHSMLAHLEFFEKTRVLVGADRVPETVLPEVPLTRALLRWLPPAPSSRPVRGTRSPDPDLELNPDLLVQTDWARPRGAGLPLVGDFPSKPPLVWVTDPGTRVWTAYHPGRRLLETILSLLQGRMRPGSLRPADHEILEHARILVPQGYRVARTRAWARIVATARKTIGGRSYAVLPGMLAPLQIAQIRRHLAALKSEGYLFADPQGNASRRHVRDDALVTFVHRQSGALIRAVTGEPVIPSFNITVCYEDGAELARHVDRTLVAWNVSCLIESGHGADVRRSWPIYLDVDGRAEEVRLDWGDALLYRGDDTPHWRPRAQLGEGQSVLLLFYANVAGLGDPPP